MTNRRLPGPDTYGNLLWSEKALDTEKLERALQELPEEEAEQVVKFFVLGNKFKELPAAVSRLRNLEWLDCRYSNQLVCLSPAVATLTKLKQFNCNYSARFVSVPSSCTALTNLKWLSLSITMLPTHLAIDICNDNIAVQSHLRLLAIHRLKPARVVARTLLLIRRFRETRLNGLQLDCAKLICQMVVQDGDSVAWEPLLERK